MSRVKWVELVTFGERENVGGSKGLGLKEAGALVVIVSDISIISFFLQFLARYSSITSTKNNFIVSFFIERIER